MLAPKRKYRFYVVYGLRKPNEVRALLKRDFAGDSVELPNATFVVATSLTPEDLARALKLAGTGFNATGLVTEMGETIGGQPIDFWKWLREKERAER